MDDTGLLIYDMYDSSEGAREISEAVLKRAGIPYQVEPGTDILSLGGVEFVPPMVGGIQPDSWCGFEEIQRECLSILEERGVLV